MTEPFDPPPFDQAYWESHWQQADQAGSAAEIEPNPYLARELSDLGPGTALDAGCGEGAEAIWLASEGRSAQPASRRVSTAPSGRS
jgi:cyclopropane fatty-acyl-phospholipid synthase-like methyltransferase